MKSLILLFLLYFTFSSCSEKKETTKKVETYQANWSSLRQHHTPEWLLGMKFGIYCHWGAQTIQIASGDKNMTRLEAIEQWTGENYNAKAWVDLMQAAGAQFGGPVAWHGTGMVNWESDITDWNSAKYGPKVDIFGSLAKELRQRGMPIISSYHTGSIWDTQWGNLTAEGSINLDPYADNSTYATMNNGRIGDPIFDSWYARIEEAINKYQPDLLWFDVGFGGTMPSHLRKHSSYGRLTPEGSNEIRTVREKYQLELISYYFNKGLKWGKEVDVIYKTHDLPPGIGMRDIEDGNLVGMQYDPWMSDINMARHYKWPHPWFYNPENPFKEAGVLVDMLVDMTSKNGRMLLNVPPKPDGTFAESAVKELYAMGDWLKINGEAIYHTLPWYFFGEGPTEITSPGQHGQGKQRGTLIPQYTAEDIRFTQKDEFLYAIALEWPGEELRIRTLGSAAKSYPGDIVDIELLGSMTDINWEHTPEALVVQFPEEKPCDFAYVLKIRRVK